MKRNSPMSEAAIAAGLRSRAKAIRLQAKKAHERAAAMPDGLEREMLATQAVMLGDGAAELDAKALALDPALGTA
jgi:hypothetical protein